MTRASLNWSLKTSVYGTIIFLVILHNSDVIIYPISNSDWDVFPGNGGSFKTSDFPEM